MESVTISWIEEHSFRTLDAGCEGMLPKRLMLLALAKCAGITAMAVFEKMHVRIDGMQVEASGELTGAPEMAYTTFTSFRLRFRITCPGEQEQEKVLYALELTHEKYCGVGRMLSQVAPFSYDVEINGHMVGQVAAPVGMK